MGLHSAEVIVLRRYPFRETSVTLSCLTDQFGKIKGLVKGLRAQPNRYRSAMEPMTINRIVFYDTRTSQLHLIGQCELLAPLTGLQRDLETARLAALFIELVDTVVPLEQPEPALYRLLRQSLEHVAMGAGQQESVRLHFIVRLLKLAGFHPQLTECTSCAGVVSEHGYWSVREGGFLCARCLHVDPRAEAVTPDFLNVLTTLAETDQPPRLEPLLIPALNARIDEFLRWRLDRPLKTLEAQGSRLKVESKNAPSAFSLEP